MRFFQAQEIIISEDSSSEPKSVRFSSDDEVTDLTTITQSDTRARSFAAGAHTIDLSTIGGTAKFLYIKGDKAIPLSINGAAAINLAAGFPTTMWANITSLSFTLTETVRISLVVAG